MHFVITRTSSPSLWATPPWTHTHTHTRKIRLQAQICTVHFFFFYFILLSVETKKEGGTFINIYTDHCSPPPPPPPPAPPLRASLPRMSKHQLVEGVSGWGSGDSSKRQLRVSFTGEETQLSKATGVIMSCLSAALSLRGGDHQERVWCLKECVCVCVCVSHLITFKCLNWWFMNS